MFGLLAMAMGGMDRVFAVAAVSLLHGGAAIVLIQSFARRNMDERSLGECLRFRLVDVSGGKVGLLIWVLGGLCVTTACAFVAVLVNEAILGDALKEQSSVSLFTDAGSGPRLAILIVAVCVFAPVFEELLFRGYVYRNLRDRWGPGAALVISSALFAAVHTDPMNFIPLFAIGACCGYAYERSGSLWVPVLIHGLWNFTTVTRILSLMGD
jgi:membrane protease YdiL (CAAX protease family)